jgi:hypothetical protein
VFASLRPPPGKQSAKFEFGHPDKLKFIEEHHNLGFLFDTMSKQRT